MKIFQRISNFVLAASMLFAAAGSALISARPVSSSRAEAQEMLQYTSGGHRLGFDATGMLVAAGDHALRVDFVNANATKPASSSTDGGVFASTTYANLWDGVTLTYDAVGIIRSTYEVAARASANAIRLRYNHPLQLLADGSLRIEFESGAMTESAPIAWQESNGKRQPVSVAFRQLSEREVGFALGVYDRSRPLFIDPVLGWNTFMGSSTYDSITDMAMDSGGNIYVIGSSLATWGTPVNAYAGGEDVFVAKLNSSGTRLWHTFLGSSATDRAGGIALRDDGAYVFVNGSSNGNWGSSPIRPYVWIYDSFVAGLNTSDGSRVWHTFLGGLGDDYGSDLVSIGSTIYIVGKSTATWGGPITAFAGGDNDGSLIKLNTAGVLFWNTFMGSTGDDSTNSVAVDSNFNAYVIGHSAATWGATPVNAFTGATDVFAAKFNALGSRQWNTFMGSNTNEYGYGITTTANGESYVVGGSNATWGAPINAFAGSQDGFVAKLGVNGDRLWNTFMGSASNDIANMTALDASGNVYVVGGSNATWGSPATPHAGDFDAFIARLDPSGARQWNTFIGGSAYDSGSSVAVNPTGKIFVSGDSDSNWGVPVNARTGGIDGFVAMLYPTVNLSVKSQGANDGWVLESTETSGVGGTVNATGTTFNLGDAAGDKQYRGILSFNTASLPDTAIITKVILKIKKQSLVGADPFASLGTLRVDIQKPFLGATPGLTSADFEAVAGKSTIGSIPNNAVNSWYSKIWKTNTFFSFINLTGTTQFRLRFSIDDNDNGTADYLKFFSGNASVASRPTLIIEYYVP